MLYITRNINTHYINHYYYEFTTDNGDISDIRRAKINLQFANFMRSHYMINSSIN